MKNSKIYLYSFGFIAVMLLLFYLLGSILLPFVIGLMLAAILNPLVKKVQRLIPNRNLAVTSLLVLTFAVFTSVLYIFGNEIVKDIQRLNGAFVTFADDHHEQIDETNAEIRSFLQQIYNTDQVQEGIHTIENESDSLQATALDNLQTALSGISSFIGSSDNSPEEVKEVVNLNWMAIFLGSIIYFLYIIYTFNYFEEKYQKYFDGNLKKMQFIKDFISDFKRIFLNYFGKRTEVVVICFAVFLITFLIVDLPGGIIIACIAAILCYIPHFHYLALIPISLGCWVLSMETGTGFFVYLGSIAGVFVVVSVLEELLFTPKIMKDYNGLNPAIMILSFALWSHLFGTVLGTLIALPLTTVILIYIDRLLVHTKEVLIEENEQVNI
ncbi:AI-2E family transporter [Paracrocinitomix mangrovi]|uniref:AI-2E family transporter n=1 Tax=Paracrocinitomix mangrovi TaxID=2862509 RepID=UPI001C8EC6F5|nr:AI-2E family transporter [Paracrocinitomix mangrovi]UKN00398.1 AI-2E family transporter [Paracrocinitomix mangrovi]